MLTIRKKHGLIDSPESFKKAKKKITVERPVQSHQEIVQELLFHARLIWNRNGFMQRTTQSEDRDFREYFGCGFLVAADLWTLVRDEGYLPPNSSIMKLLWTLLFLKRYSTEGHLCNTVKADRTIFRETCWEFLNSITYIEHKVVS